MRAPTTGGPTRGGQDRRAADAARDRAGEHAEPRRGRGGGPGRAEGPGRCARAGRREGPPRGRPEQPDRVRRDRRRRPPPRRFRGVIAGGGPRNPRAIARLHWWVFDRPRPTSPAYGG